MNEADRIEWHRTVTRELEIQAKQLQVRQVIARRTDGVDEVLNIIQTVTDNGVVVYVQAPRAEGDALGDNLATTIDILEQTRREVSAKQAQIDRLMIEYCPEEMTPEQIENWKRHQVPAGPEASARLDAAIGRTNGKA